MKRITIAFIVLVVFSLVLPMSAQSESTVQVAITPTIRTYVLDAPRANAELVGILQTGVELSAFGRDTDGNWLRIMDGWVLGKVFNTEGEVGALPDATHSFLGSTVAHTYLYDGPSERWFNSLAGIGEGTQILIIGRNEDSTWLQVPGGWVDAAEVEHDGDVSLLPVTPSGVIITAKTRTFILAEPDLSAEFVDVFEAGQEALAIGQAGDWVQIAQGWVSAEAIIESAGDQGTLPFTAEGIPMVIKSSINLYDGYRGHRTGEQLNKGDKAVAIGRANNAQWLQFNDGWILVGRALRFYVEFDGDITDLPVTEGMTTTTTQILSSARSTATPRPTSTPRPSTRSSSNWNASTIRTLVTRHTKDIRILKLDVTNSATTIDYDLKPWPFVPNEQIANEVAFKIICALRKGQQIPNTLKLIGQGHFKSDIGRKFKSPSVEIHIRASNANRIVCSGNDYSDINWRSVSSLYKSYPIPRGASVDYD